MTWISYGNTIVAPVVPLLLVAHKYLAGEMTLGTVVCLGRSCRRAAAGAG